MSQDLGKCRVVDLLVPLRRAVLRGSEPPTVDGFNAEATESRSPFEPTCG